MYYINHSKSWSYLDNGTVTEVSSSSASPNSGQASTGWSPPHTSHPIIGIENNTFLPINSKKVNGYVNLYVELTGKIVVTSTMDYFTTETVGNSSVCRSHIVKNF